MKPSRGFSSILLILLMVLVLGAAAFLYCRSHRGQSAPVSSTATSTTKSVEGMSFDVYQGNDFQLEYPSNWYVATDTDKNGSAEIYFTSAKPTVDSQGGVGVPLPPGAMYAVIGTTTQESCNSAETKWFADFNTGKYDDQLTKVVCKNNYYITVKLWPNDPEQDAHKQLLQHVIDTFQIKA